MEITTIVTNKTIKQGVSPKILLWENPTFNDSLSHSTDISQ